MERGSRSRGSALHIFNTEDIAIMRTLPGVRIITPTDTVMGEAAADYSLSASQPACLRFGAACEGSIYENRAINFEKGFDVLRKGKDITIIASGEFTAQVLNIAENLYRNLGIDAKIIDLYSIPFNAEEFIKALNTYPILTVEEHILEGGIGSAVTEALNDKNSSNKVKRLGINFNGSYPNTSGSREYFIEKYNLLERDIINELLAKLHM